MAFCTHAGSMISRWRNTDKKHPIPTKGRQCCPCSNKDRVYYWPFMNHNKLNVLPSGGIKDLNHNSEGHGRFHSSQNALVPKVRILPE